MLTDEQKRECRKLLPIAEQELMPALIKIHAYGISMEECRDRVKEDTATICALIMSGHLILKHKEGSTVDDILKIIKDKFGKEDSTPQDKKAKDESSR